LGQSSGGQEWRGWANLQAGKSGAGEIGHFDASGFPVRIGAEVKDLVLPPEIAKSKSLKFASRPTRFGLAAAEEALADAGIRPQPDTAHRWGFSAGTGMMVVEYEDLKNVHRYCADEYGDIKEAGFIDPRFPADPVVCCRTQTNAGLSLITQHFGIQGYATAVHTACASGGQALGTALKVLRRGTVDYVLAGGFDSMLNPLGLSSFCLLGAVSPDNDNPTRASRPFDATRNGFVLGEGAGFLVLEDWQAAVDRGANIYAELAGDGNSLSSYRITDSHPSGDGPIQSMRAAMADAGIGPESVDYVNAHGTSTLMNDRSECAAMREVLDGYVDKVAVSSTKSCMGHLIAAAGAVEAGICALAIRDGIAPVNANHEQFDSECDVDLVLGESRPTKIRAVVSNSLGFGGSNSSLVLRHPGEVEA